MQLQSSVTQLIADALEYFDDPGRSLAASARRALRVAIRRHDYVSTIWLLFELTTHIPQGNVKIGEPAIIKTRQQMTVLLGEEKTEKCMEKAYVKWERNRAFGKKGENARLQAESLGQLEATLALTQSVYDDTKVPDNLTQIDAYRAARDIEAGKAKLLPNLHHYQQIIENIRSSIYIFLVESEVAVFSGEIYSPLFVRAQDRIDQGLERLAPDARAKFLAAQSSLLSGSGEDLAHALSSCRRMIKALADALYPPPEKRILKEGGKDIKLDDAHYANRLIQYAKEKMGESQKEVLDSTLNSLMARLRALISLSSKGVHSEVTVAEAETCVLWTYMLAADFIRLADGTMIYSSSEN